MGSDDECNRRYLEEAVASLGAVIAGRRKAVMLCWVSPSEGRGFESLLGLYSRR
jgi:hypothetical protein